MLSLPVGVYVAAQVAGALAVPWRRSAPAAVAGAQALLNLVTPTQASFVAAYSLGAHESDRRRGAVAFAAMIATWCLGAQLWRLEDSVTAPVMLVTAIVVGMYVRARRTIYADLVARAERAEADRIRSARQAVAADRSRLASEMHDRVANRVTLMVLQAGALSVTQDEPTVVDAAEAIRRHGVEAMDELRTVIDLLRSSEPDALPPRTLDDLGRVLERAADAGLTVRFHERGTSPERASYVTEAVRRVIDESLTNAAKFAPRSDVDVEVAFGDHGAGVRVRNSPARDPVDPAAAAAGSGSGLRELGRYLNDGGGALQVGRDSGGGFDVRARVGAGPGSGRREVDR